MSRKPYARGINLVNLSMNSSHLRALRGEAHPHPASGRAHPASGREVFEILARENADMLTGYLRSLVKSAHLVDDLFQETMLTAWRRLADYDRNRPFAPWLRGIALNHVLKQRERSSRDFLNLSPEILESIEARFEELDHSKQGFRQTVERLFYCIQELPEKLRLAIRLSYQKGLRLKEAAKHLDCSEEAAKKRVQRARKLLAVCLRSSEVQR